MVTLMLTDARLLRSQRHDSSRLLCYRSDDARISAGVRQRVEHPPLWPARQGILDDARTAVADLLKAEVSEVVFTSGGTESDNFAIRGVADALEVTGRRHHRERNRARGRPQYVQGAPVGWTTTLLPVGTSGIVEPGPRGRHHRSDCARLGDARQQRNQDRPASGRAGSDRAHAWGPHRRGAVGRQASRGRATLGADLLSLSAHKFNGPKGAGALWIKRGTRVAAILTGGKHERNRRAGTENVAAIAGLGAAAALASGKMTAEAARLSALRDRLENEILAAIPDTAVNGARDARARTRRTSVSAASKPNRY